MPEGGDGAACPAALPDEGRWVPRPVALARQQAQEAVRHAPTSPSVGVTWAPTPKLDTISPQRKGGEDSTAPEPLKDKGGAAGREDAGGARALPVCHSSSSGLRALWAPASARQGKREGLVAEPWHRSPGPSSLGCEQRWGRLGRHLSLASFPPMSGAPAYKLWETHLQELSGYVQRYPAPEQRVPSPLVRETELAAAPGGGAANTATRRAVMGLALASPAQPTAAPPRPATPVVARGRTALTTEIPAPAIMDAAVVTLPRGRESRDTVARCQPERHGPAPEVILPGTSPVVGEAPGR
jgi:hypothetical protein